MFSGTTKLLTTLAVLLALGILGMVAVLVARTTPRVVGPNQAELVDEHWEELRRGGAILGTMNAVHTMVVFTDYECKACRDLDESIRQVLEAHPHKLAVVIRHNPLRSIHPVAELAANAAACAARLGSFAAYHRVLFEVQDSLRAMEWGRWAARAGIADTSALVDCVSERGGRMDVVTDINLAKVIDLRRSPSVLLDGAILGSQPSAHQIEAELLRDPR